MSRGIFLIKILSSSLLGGHVLILKQNIRYYIPIEKKGCIDRATSKCCWLETSGLYSKSVISRLSSSKDEFIALRLKSKFSLRQLVSNFCSRSIALNCKLLNRSNSSVRLLVIWFPTELKTVLKIFVHHLQ